MKKIFLTLILAGLAGAAAAERNGELEADRSRLLAEISARAPLAGGAGLESRLIREVEALGAGAGKSAGFGEEARLRLIDAVWALGETGGPDAERALAKAGRGADLTLRLNIAAALEKIAARSGAARGAGAEASAAHMEPGDILFRKGYFGLLNSAIGAQTVGHVGVYAGLEDGEPMVIEGWVPVRKVSFKVFIAGWPFYGNYTTSPEPSDSQRAGIVDYARAQLGKRYDMAHNIQKGPEKFDCVGLAEAAYEAAGLNPTPDDFEAGWGWPLTPTEQYEHTFPNF